MQSVLAALAAILFELQAALEHFFIFLAKVAYVFAHRAFKFNEVILGHSVSY